MRAKLPDDTRVWIFDKLEQCSCKLQHKPACSPGVNPNDCCAFDYVLTCASPLNCSNTWFSCNGDFFSNDTALMSM